MIPKCRVWDRQHNCMTYKGIFVDISGKIGGYYACDTFIELDSDELETYVFMGSTGINDDSGREIFEGDIVQIEYYPNINAEIKLEKLIITTICKYTNRFSSYELVNVENNNAYMVGYDGSAVRKKTIIGNIFENPELIRGVVVDER